MAESWPPTCGPGILSGAVATLAPIPLGPPIHRSVCRGSAAPRLAGTGPFPGSPSSKRWGPR